MSKHSPLNPTITDTRSIKSRKREEKEIAVWVKWIRIHSVTSASLLPPTEVLVLLAHSATQLANALVKLFPKDTRGDVKILLTRCFLVDRLWNFVECLRFLQKEYVAHFPKAPHVPSTKLEIECRRSLAGLVLVHRGCMPTQETLRTVGVLSVFLRLNDVERSGPRRELVALTHHEPNRIAARRRAGSVRQVR